MCPGSAQCVLEHPVFLVNVRLMHSFHFVCFFNLLTECHVAKAPSVEELPLWSPRWAIITIVWGAKFPPTLWTTCPPWLTETDDSCRVNYQLVPSFSPTARQFENAHLHTQNMYIFKMTVFFILEGLMPNFGLNCESFLPTNIFDGINRRT